MNLIEMKFAMECLAHRQCAETEQICGGRAGVICCNEQDVCFPDLGTAGHCQTRYRKSTNQEI